MSDGDCFAPTLIFVCFFELRSQFTLQIVCCVLGGIILSDRLIVLRDVIAILLLVLCFFMEDFCSHTMLACVLLHVL